MRRRRRGRGGVWQDNDALLCSTALHQAGTTDCSPPLAAAAAAAVNPPLRCAQGSCTAGRAACMARRWG